MSAELLKSKSLCRPSIRPSSVSQLSLNLRHGFLSNFGCCFPWAIRRGNFFIYWKFFFWFFYEYFSFSLTWDAMGANISKRYSSYKSQPKVFKLFLNFLPNGPHKTTFGIFEILSFWFLAIFRKFQIHHCSLWRNQNLNYLENERS